MSQFILLKRLHFLKAINAIIALSLHTSKQAHERCPGKTWCLPRFLGEYRGKVPGCRRLWFWC